MQRAVASRLRAFTLIELLVVIAIIGILSSLLVPVLGEARLAAHVSRAHGELRQVTVALQVYRDQYDVFPPARTFCASMMPNLDDYNHLPPELVDAGCIDHLPEDVFNPGHTYKYIAPGVGWANGDLSILAIWVPDEFPEDTGRETAYFDQESSPVQCAVWSAGPGGAKSVFESDSMRYPLPPRHWYPRERDGLLVHYYWKDCWYSSQ
ncbi:MAG: type II secretion system protein [bacterium]